MGIIRSSSQVHAMRAIKLIVIMLAEVYREVLQCVHYMLHHALLYVLRTNTAVININSCSFCILHPLRCEEMRFILVIGY